jgi:hypothetical protein
MSKYQITVAGIHSEDIMKCFTCARQLLKTNPDVVSFDEKTDLKLLFPAQWDTYVKNLQNEKKGDFYHHKGNLIVFLNNT